MAENKKGRLDSITYYRKCRTYLLGFFDEAERKRLLRLYIEAWMQDEFGEGASKLK